jgi:hypothetical protein
LCTPGATPYEVYEYAIQLSLGGESKVRKTRKFATIYGVTSCFVLLLLSCQGRVGPSEAPIQAADNSKLVVQRLAEADRLYAQREELAKVRQGIALLQDAQRADYASYDAAWRLAKFNYYLGSHSSDQAEKERAFRDGIEAGKQAVRLLDGKPDGHFWLGANYGGMAEISTLAALTAIEDIKHEMETVIRLDEKYEGSSAYMVLGQMYLKAPALLGGDRRKAIEYLERGLDISANNVMMRLRLAEAYIAVNRKQDARKQIDVLLSMKPDPDHVPEDTEALARGRELRDQLK